MCLPIDPEASLRQVQETQPSMLLACNVILILVKLQSREEINEYIDSSNHTLNAWNRVQYYH